MAGCVTSRHGTRPHVCVDSEDNSLNLDRLNIDRLNVDRLNLDRQTHRAPQLLTLSRVVGFRSTKLRRLSLKRDYLDCL